MRGTNCLKVVFLIAYILQLKILTIVHKPGTKDMGWKQLTDNEKHSQTFINKFYNGIEHYDDTSIKAGVPFENLKIPHVEPKSLEV